MSFDLNSPVLVVGLGGIGSKLVSKISDSLGFDTLLISPDDKDLNSDFASIKISTDSIVNPSVQSIRGFANREYENIKTQIKKYSSVIILANLAGKTGSAVGPIVSKICKEEQKGVVSLAIMPFKYEKERIFQSGVALKRMQAESDCTLVIDNDALLESNPDMTIKDCHTITNSAIICVINSLKSSSIPQTTSILSTSNSEDLETSLKNSLKMLYENAPPTAVKRSILYLMGGNDIPVGILNSISKLSNGVMNEDAQLDISNNSSEDSHLVMLSSIQGETRFEKYDPLGVIPSDKTLDWDEPDCSLDCKLDLYQLE